MLARIKAKLLRRENRGGPTERAASSATHAEMGPLRITQGDFGGFDCVILDDAAPSPHLAVVFLHGYGSNNRQVARLGEALCTSVVKSCGGRIRFYFPNGPVVVSQHGSKKPAKPAKQGRAWWDLDMERYQAAFLGNNPSLIRRDHPEGLDSCSERVCKLIRSVRLHSGLPSAKIVVGGFSQVDSFPVAPVAPVAPVHVLVPHSAPIQN